MPRKPEGVYPKDWKRIATEVKDKAGWLCIRCGHPHDPDAGYCLTVHHLSNDKSNCDWWNLLALCQRCHLSVQARVWLERPYFLPHSGWIRPYVAGWYASLYGLPTDEEFVRKHVDALLDVGQQRIELAAAFPAQETKDHA